MSMTIMIIRHAEKPTGAIQGVTATGTGSDKENKDSLIVQGWQRAGGLASLFDAKGPLAQITLPRPKVIYASDPEKSTDGSGSHSQRPLQTVTPAAAKLGLTVNLSFAKGQESALAAALAQQTGPVLVAWQHESILDIAVPLMGGSSKGLPKQWPGDRFDVVWVFERKNPGDPFVFSQVCQNLLAGDSDQPIS